MYKQFPCTQSELKQFVHYDPITGIFRRINPRACNANQPMGYISDTGYMLISICNSQHKAHRIAWFYMTGINPTCSIDHIDRNKLNNCFNNLRLATRNENACNHSRQNKYGHPGLSYSNYHNCWVAKITYHGKEHTKQSKDQDICIMWLLENRPKIHGAFSNL